MDAHALTVWPERFSPKVRTLRHCSRLRSGALPMIDRGDVCQAPTVVAHLGFTAGRWLRRSPGAYKAGQPDCKIQRSGRNGQTFIDV